MLIEIADTAVESIPFKNEQKGTSGTIRKQQGFWFKPDSKYPVPFEFSLGEDNSAIPLGNYEVNPESLMNLDRFNSLSVDSYNVYDSIKAGQFTAPKK